MLQILVTVCLVAMRELKGKRVAISCEGNNGGIMYEFKLVGGNITTKNFYSSVWFILELNGISSRKTKMSCIVIII